MSLGKQGSDFVPYSHGCMLRFYSIFRWTSIPILFLYKPDDDHELEFLIEKDGKVVPIEVKAGNTATVSLNNFIKKYEPAVAYKLINGNIGTVDSKKTIPHYMAMFI